MRSSLPLVALLVLLGQLALAAEPITITEERLDLLAKDALDKWNAPGLAVAIIQPGSATLLKGYGARELGKKEGVTEDTLFPIASCTKSFTAALIAQLVEEGRLHWDDPVQKHLPDFRLSNPHVTALLTVRDLLAHRTGIAGHDLLWYRAPWNQEQILKRMEFLPLEGQFRHTYHYSSLPVMAAGRLAEKVTGRKWDQLIREGLAKPLRIEPITFTTAESKAIADRALGYRRGDSGKMELMPDYPILEANAAGSISTSVRGLSRWLQFQLLEGVLDPAGERLLAARQFEEMRRPHVFMPLDEIIGPSYPESKQVSYGLGWVRMDYRDEVVYAHGGLIDGFRSQILFLPERKLAIALLNNLHNSKLNIALSYSLLDYLLDHKAKDWNEHFWKQEEAERRNKQEAIAQRDRLRRPDVPPSVPVGNYTGTYVHPAYGAAKVTLQSGKLSWAWSGFASELEHYQGDLFRVTSGYFANELIAFSGQNDRPNLLAIFGQYFRRD